MRTRKQHFAQVKHAKKVKGTCEFCTFNLKLPQVLKENTCFWIVRNIFPYDTWDTGSVSKHLMIVPKRHVDSIAHFNIDERREYVKLLAKYEKQGFSIYARAADNAMKSIAHQHTHLIKLDNKLKRFILWSKKPRLLITK